MGCALSGWFQMPPLPTVLTIMPFVCSWRDLTLLTCYRTSIYLYVKTNWQSTIHINSLKWVLIQLLLLNYTLVCFHWSVLKTCYKKYTYRPYHGVHCQNVVEDVIYYSTHHFFYETIAKNSISNIIGLSYCSNQLAHFYPRITLF